MRSLFPCDAPVKSRRLKTAHETNHVSWAFDKFLRERGGGVVYPENPYLQVFQFRPNVYGFYCHNLDGQDDMWQYLLIGPEKAMLIDTGYGIGNMHALIRRLIGERELIVVNTHDHPDHAYGNCVYGRVYCHESLVPYLELQDETIYDYLFDENGKPIWIDFDRADLPAFRPFEIIGVPDGTIFHLGGDYDVELIHVGGHAAGLAVFLDKKGRNLFAGDAACSDMYFINLDACHNTQYKAHNGRIYSPSVNEKYRSLDFVRERTAYLISRKGEFDHIFPGHYIPDLECDLFEDMLRAFDEIAADPLGAADFVKEGPFGMKERCKYVRGFSTILYLMKG